MATFIPEWNRLSRRDLGVKRLLDQLDEGWVVRRPLRPAPGGPAFLLQHPVHGWLAVSVCEAPYDHLDPRQLFRHPDAVAFARTLDALARLDGLPAQARNGLRRAVLLWSCSRAQARVLAREGRRSGAPPEIRLVSRVSLAGWGARLVRRLAAPLPADDEATVRGWFSPEAEIPAAYLGRPSAARDNSARLARLYPRLFLDLAQEGAAKLDLDPPVEQAPLVRDLSVRLINGVAGSGKTLIALARARLLAQLFPAQRVLLLIFNTPIVADIVARLHRAHGGVPPNLEVSTFFSWASGQWQQLFGAPPLMSSPRDDEELIQRLVEKWPELGPGARGLRDELDFINEAMIAEEGQYREARRSGRGFALRPGQRSLIWQLHQEVTRCLASQGKRMWSRLPCDLAEAARGGRLASYRHVLIDEAQFFAPSWFEVVKLALAPQGSLFLCADPNQGFLKSRLSWKRAGLDVAGRTRKLRRSYRTTRAILDAASRVLAGSVADGGEDFLQPDLAGMTEGERPLLRAVASPQDAVDWVVNEVAALDGQGQALSDLLIVFGGGVSRDLLYSRLCQKLGEARVWWFNRDQDKKRPPGGYGADHLRVASLESATGLEAPVVFLLGVERALSEGAGGDETSARKLYMAMTRAARQLVLVSTESLPPPMALLFDRLP
jgi:hypothetical protein